VLSLADLEYQFPGLVRIAGGVIRCADVTPRRTLHYYVALAAQSDAAVDLLLVSEDRIDDAFAALVLSTAVATHDRDVLQKRPLPDNDYGMDTLIVAPPGFHAYFEGRLDTQRDKLFLCVPAFASEFAGNEDAETFRLLANKVVPHRDWTRFAHPRTQLRFDNPVTGGGTIGDGYVFATYDLVMRELANLDGVTDGFIEILNYRGDVLELLSPEPGRIVAITGRDDGTRHDLSADAAADTIWSFLATPDGG
jgi:hypothetical protein